MTFGSCCILKDNEFYAMKSHEVHIEGVQKCLILNLEVSQTFRNTSEEIAHISYVFPNDLKICIYETSFILNDQLIRPKLVEKKEGREIYKEAVVKGKTAIYGSNIAFGLTEFKLGNLPINSECKVILKMAFKANLIDLNTFYFKFPLDVYFPNGSVNCLNIKSNFSMSVQADKETIDSVFSNVTNGQYDSKNKIYKISNEIKNNVDENSIILRFKTQDIIESSLMLSLQNNYCAVSIVNDHKEDDIINKEYIFLVDCSGSMYGESIRNAGTALEIFVRSLPEKSFFNIVRFGSKFELLYDHSIEYNEKSAARAIESAKTISANLGGTNIYRPLEEIFKTRPLFGQRCVFILTDGEVKDRENVINLVELNSKSNTCFTIGFGSGCDAGLMERIAEISGGKSDFIQEGDSISEKVIPQLQSSLSRVIKDIEIYCEGEDNDSFEITPFPIPCLSYNSAIQLFINGKGNKDENPFQHGILVSGQSKDKLIDIPIYNVIELDNYEEDQFGCSKGMNIWKAIAPLFSFDLLKNYEQMLDISPKMKKKAIEISIASGVLCKFTGYVGMIESKNRSSARSLEKNGFVIIDGKQCKILNMIRAKTGKHGHGKTSLVLQDLSTGERIEKMLPSSQVNIVLNEKSDANSAKNNNFDLILLLNYQKIDGYWENHQEVNKIAGIDIDHIDDLKLNDEELEDKCIATFVAIAILRVMASDKIKSWKMIEEKGIAWLKKTLAGTNVDGLLIEIEQLVQKQTNK